MKIRRLCNYTVLSNLPIQKSKNNCSIGFWGSLIVR